MNLSSDQDGSGQILTDVATVTYYILCQNDIILQRTIQLCADVVVWDNQPVPIPSSPSPTALDKGTGYRIGYRNIMDAAR